MFRTVINVSKPASRLEEMVKHFYMMVGSTYRPR
jgi:hypothetical protein